MTPIVSLETIMAAMICLCANNTSDQHNFYTTLNDRINVQYPNKTMAFVPMQKVQNIKKNLIQIKASLVEILQQQAKIVEALRQHKSQQEELDITAKVFEHCPSGLKAKNNQIINLKLPKYETLFPVLCNGKNHGGGWLVIQQRYDGSQNFTQPWWQYQSGFGQLEGEFFLGLQKLHALIDQRKHELLILLEDFDNDRRFAHYDHFSIGSEQEDYALKELGNYSGNAGDSLRYHVQQQFSTYDRDNDKDFSNCANNYKAGWWYNSCLTSNLNGQYLTAGMSKESHGEGITWLSFRGLEYTLKSVKIMIRPKD